jgi:hypothetical protein
MSELGRIPIPPIAIEEQEEIDATFWNARSLERVAIDKYQEAKNALEATLGIDEEFIQSATGYLTHLSEIITDGRADADYFQPQFRHIHEQLDTHDTVALQKLAEISKGIEVGSSAYRDTGRLFLRVSNIKEMEIEATASDKYISDSLYQTLHLFRPSIGDILLTKDGSPGICMVVDNVVDGIISGGVVRLKLRDASVPAEYLALAINSRACRMQVEQECSGAVILHWKPSSIRKLRIPLLADEEMASIAKLVSESKQAKRESFRLLYEARDRVEQLIEEAIQ